MELDQSYCLIIHPYSSENLQIIEELRRFSEDAEFALDENGESSGSGEWPYLEKELREFSLLYPDKVFDIMGPEYESWQKYFKNGKMQRCNGEVVYPPFDESKLE